MNATGADEQGKESAGDARAKSEILPQDGTKSERNPNW